MFGDNTSKVSRWITLCLVAGVVLVVVYLSFTGMTLESLLGVSSESIRWSFVGLMVVLPLFGFPISSFYVFAAVNFGFWEGVGLCATSLLANMSIGYVIGKYCFRAQVGKFVQRYPRFDLQTKQRNAVRATILIRTVPGVPYFLQSYLLAAAGVPFVLYLVLSVACQVVLCAILILTIQQGVDFHHWLWEK